MKAFDLETLEKLETPCYIFDEEELARNFADFSSALREAWSERAYVAYSVKTNPLPWILDIARQARRMLGGSGI